MLADLVSVHRCGCALLGRHILCLAMYVLIYGSSSLLCYVVLWHVYVVLTERIHRYGVPFGRGEISDQ